MAALVVPWAGCAKIGEPIDPNASGSGATSGGGGTSAGGTSGTGGHTGGSGGAGTGGQGGGTGGSSGGTGGSSGGTGGGTMEIEPGGGDPNANVRLDARVTHQTIDGFGAFGPKKVWWDSAPYYDDAYLDLIIDDLGSTIVRTQLYWDFENSNDNSDPSQINWAGFNKAANSDNGKQLDFIRALKQRNVRLITSVWTPPVWMKLNPNDGLASFCHGQCGGTFNSSLKEEFAEYLVAYVQMLKEEADIDLYALSIQNEPVFANPFESCVYEPGPYADVLKVVGARFKAEGIKTKLFGPEHMGSFDWNSGFFSSILDDADARQYLSAYAVHSYLDGVSADYGSADGWSKISARASAKGVPLWMTETSDFNKSGWDLAMDMGLGLHLALKYGKLSAWVYWYYADAIVANNQPLPLFHAFKSYYKYVLPGSVMIDATSEQTDVLVTAYRAPNRLMVVLINKGNAERTVTLATEGVRFPAAFNVYRSSGGEGHVALGSNSNNSFVLPASTFTTLVATW